jgi:hypothetical protein
MLISPTVPVPVVLMVLVEPVTVTPELPLSFALTVTVATSPETVGLLSPDTLTLPALAVTAVLPEFVRLTLPAVPVTPLTEALAVTFAFPTAARWNGHGWCSTLPVRR